MSGFPGEEPVARKTGPESPRLDLPRNRPPFDREEFRGALRITGARRLPHRDALLVVTGMPKPRSRSSRRRSEEWLSIQAKLPGWVATGAGFATLLTLPAVDTPLSGLGIAAFMPALVLSVVFRIWCGVALHRSADAVAHRSGPVSGPAAHGWTT